MKTGLAAVDLDSFVKGLETMRLPAATAFALLGVVWLLLALRKTFLWWHGRHPRVQITTFEWTRETDGADREAAWVTSLFRNQLSALQLDALDALPERAPGAPLVEIFAGVGQATVVGKVMAGVVKAVKPDCAYIVYGTLRPHVEGVGGHLAVELVDRSRHQTLISVTLSAADWESCTREAAMAVAGALYPRIGPRYQGPWTQWSQAVPRQLVMDYHQALDYERANRLEEALGAYHKALTQDPLNAQLRVCIAMIQERLGLCLDAWATYQAVTTEADKQAWRGPERRVRLVAQYRLAVLLGYEKAGHQWMRPQRRVPSIREEERDERGEPDEHGQWRNKRDDERQVLRAELALALVEEDVFKRSEGRQSSRLDSASATQLWPALFARLRALELSPTERAREQILALLCDDPQVDETWSKTDWPYGQDDRVRLPGSVTVASVRRVDFVNELLQILALRRLEELRAWLRPWPAGRNVKQWRRHRPPLRRVLARREIAPAALELAFTWIRLRLRATRDSTFGPSEPDDGAYERMLRKPPFATSSDRVRVQWFSWRPRWPGTRADAWLIHYNAACTAAVPLLTQCGDAASPAWPLLPQAVMPETLVADAVAHLERYAHRAGSGRFASQEAWLGVEDPDLAGLARQPRFQEWARHHLSQPLPSKRPDRSVDLGHHAACVLHHGAQALAAEWRTRARTSVAAAEVVEDWWRSEHETWNVVADACLEFRSWRVRLAAIDAVNALRLAAGQAQIGNAPGWRERTREDNEDRLRRIADVVRSSPSGSERVLQRVACRRDEIRQALEEGAVRIGNTGLDTKREREAALRESRLWRRLADAVDPAANERDVQQALAKFENEAAQL